MGLTISRFDSSVALLVGQSGPVAQICPTSISDKWTGALLSGLAGPSLLTDLHDQGSFTDLAERGHIPLGTVTRNNGYFAMSPEQANELGIGMDELVRISPPGSHHLRGIRFTASALAKIG